MPKYFENEENLKLIDELKMRNVNMEYHGKQVVKDESFSDKKFVITGTISIMTRDKLKEEITTRGGLVIDSVSKKIDVVIVGDSPGSKYDKAKTLGITIWNEETLKEMLNEKDGSNE